MAYYTVRGFRKKKLGFESIGLMKRKAISLRKDIVKYKYSRGGRWAKGMKFTLKKV